MHGVVFLTIPQLVRMLYSHSRPPASSRRRVIESIGPHVSSHSFSHPVNAIASSMVSSLMGAKLRINTLNLPFAVAEV
jgi:hypothetical protein